MIILVAVGILGYIGLNKKPSPTSNIEQPQERSEEIADAPVVRNDSHSIIAYTTLPDDDNRTLGMGGTRTIDSVDNTIYMKNITTKEENIICQPNCANLRVYYPFHLETMRL